MDKQNTKQATLKITSKTRGASFINHHSPPPTNVLHHLRATMDSILFHHPLFPPFSITTRHQTTYSPPKPPLISTYKLSNFTCRALGNLGDSENGSVFGVSGSNASELFPKNQETFKTVEAEITPETIDFFTSDAEGDPDCPTDGFSSVEDALATLRLGKVCYSSDFLNYNKCIVFIYVTELRKCI